MTTPVTIPSIALTARFQNNHTKSPRGETSWANLFLKGLEEEKFSSNGKADLPQNFRVSVFVSAFFVQSAVFLILVNVLGARERALGYRFIGSVPFIGLFRQLEYLVALAVFFLAHIMKARGYTSNGQDLEEHVVRCVLVFACKINYIASQIIPRGGFPLQNATSRASDQGAALLPILGVILSRHIKGNVISAKCAMVSDLVVFCSRLRHLAAAF